MLFLLTSNVAQTIEEAVSGNSDVANITSWQGLIDYFQSGLPSVLNFLLKLLAAIIVLLVGRKIIKGLRKLVRRFLKKMPWDEGVRQFLDKLIFAGMHFLLIMIVLSCFGITAATVVAVIGSVGLSVGLALQGTLSNFAGGVLILILRPFKVGDYILEHTHDKEGFVVEIQLCYTKLKTYDNQIIVLPNGNLANSSLTNLTTQDKRRVDIDVGISYHADIRQAKTVLEKVLRAEEKGLKDESEQVFVSELGDNAVIMGLRIWVKTEDYWEVKWRLTEEIKYALDDAGIEIPYPQITVSVQEPQKTESK